MLDAFTFTAPATGVGQVGKSLQVAVLLSVPTVAQLGINALLPPNGYELTHDIYGRVFITPPPPPNAPGGFPMGPNMPPPGINNNNNNNNNNRQ